MFVFLFSVTVIHRHRHSHSSLLKLLHNNLGWARRVLESQHNDCRVAAQPSRWLAWLNCSKHNARCACVSRFHKHSQPGHDSRSGHFAPSIAAKPKSYGHWHRSGQKRRMAEMVLPSQQTSNKAIFRHVLDGACFLGINVVGNSPTLLRQLIHPCTVSLPIYVVPNRGNCCFA